MAISILGEAAVRLRPEASGFAAEADQEVGSSLPGVAKKAAGIFAAAFAAVKVGEFLKDSVAQASDLSESASKVGVVFGDNAQQVKDFAATAAISLGQSQQQALEATGTFGNLLRSLGMTSGESAKMSTSMVQLAGDLASFNNVDPQTALDALRSGLTGETEPLKQFGINLNDATLKQEAMRLGLDASGPTLSASVKAQAAYSLIMQQSTLAQGDFARTSQGLANQQRIISAQFTDLKANIGQGFLPFVNLGAQAISKGLMPALLTVTSYMADFGTAAQNGIADLQSYASAAYNGADASTVAFDSSWQRIGFSLGQLANDAQGYWSTFSDAAQGGGEGMLAQEPSLAGFLSRFGTGLHLLAQSAEGSWHRIQASAAEQLAPIQAQIAPQLASIKATLGQAFNPDGAALSGSGSGFLGFLSGMLAKAEPLITGLIDKIGPVLQTVLPLIGQAFTAIIPIVQQVFAQIGPIIGQLLPIITEISGIWRQVFLGAFEALLPVLPGIVTALGGLISALVSGLGPILSQLGPLIKSVVDAIQGTLVAVITALLPIIPVLVNVLTQVAQILVGALLDAISAIAPILPPLITAFATIAQVLAGVLLQALGAILPVIPTLVQAILQLVMAAVLPLLPLLPVLANLLVTIIQALAPLIPPIIQVVTLLIQMAVLAIQPLFPVINILIGLFVMIVSAMAPIITIIVQVIGWILQFAGTIVGAIAGAVGSVVGWFTSLWQGISSIVQKIVQWVVDKWTGMVQGIQGVLHGIGDAVSGAFSAVGGIIKGALNGVISLINNTIIWGINKLIDGVNLVNPFDDIPHIPKIPELHIGGVIDWGPSGEGLAMLRSKELVATPEQRALGEGLLEKLLTGQLPIPATPGAAQQPVQVVNNITQLPGESGAALAARVSDRVVFNLNNGVTAAVGSGGTPQ